MLLRYPLQLAFKTLAISSKVSVRDAAGKTVLFVKQKAFRLREAVNVFADEGQTTLLFSLQADRVWDFSARYHMREGDGAPLGSIKRLGMRSLWRSQYQIELTDGSTYIVQEEKPWVKVVDGLVGEIPILGIFTGYFLHPSFVLTGSGGSLLFRLTKQLAFFEGRFKIEKFAELDERRETALLLGLVMMILIERSRG